MLAQTRSSRLGARTKRCRWTRRNRSPRHDGLRFASDYRAPRASLPSRPDCSRSYHSAASNMFNSASGRTWSDLISTRLAAVLRVGPGLHPMASPRWHHSPDGRPGVPLGSDAATRAAEPDRHWPRFGPKAIGRSRSCLRPGARRILKAALAMAGPWVEYTALVAHGADNIGAIRQLFPRDRVEQAYTRTGAQVAALAKSLGG